MLDIKGNRVRTTEKPPRIDLALVEWVEPHMTHTRVKFRYGTVRDYRHDWIEIVKYNRHLMRIGKHHVE